MTNNELIAYIVKSGWRDWVYISTITSLCNSRFYCTLPLVIANLDCKLYVLKD